MHDNAHVLVRFSDLNCYKCCTGSRSCGGELEARAWKWKGGQYCSASSTGPAIGERKHRLFSCTGRRNGAVQAAGGLELKFSFSYILVTCLLELFPLPQSDKLQEQQDLIEELQCHLSTSTLLGLGLNLRSRPHTAPMGSLQHSQNGGCYRQVSSQQGLCFSQCFCIVQKMAFLSCRLISQVFKTLKSVSALLDVVLCVCMVSGWYAWSGWLPSWRTAHTNAADRRRKPVHHQPRETQVCFLYTSQCLQLSTVSNRREINSYPQCFCCKIKRYAFNCIRPINLTWTKKDLLSQGLAGSGLPAHLQETEHHPCLARKACECLRSQMFHCVRMLLNPELVWPKWFLGVQHYYSSNYTLHTNAPHSKHTTALS